MGSLRLKVGLDSSVLVALFVEEHGFHPQTSAELERLRRQNVQWVVACHALLECFSVLTRMPAPHRFGAEETERMLHENFGEDAVIAGLDGKLAWSAIRKIVSGRFPGGPVYDAAIAGSTFAAGASLLLTWNVRDFLRVAPAGLEVMTPEQHAARGSRVH